MILLLIILMGVLWCAHEHWMRLDKDRSPWQRFFWKWAAQGLAIPILVWAGINLGLSDRFPAFVPRLAEAHAHNAPWLRLWVGVAITGAVLIGVYWAALTYLWLITVIAIRAPRIEFALTAGIAGIILILLSVPLIYFGGWHHLGTVLVFCLLPITHMTIGLGQKEVATPAYGKAIARMKFGKYSEAEWAVIEELEKSDKDFEGWMMLAELYATQYRKMEDTAKVIVDLCNDRETQPFQVSLACDKLADWQLEIWRNPDGARAALELLCRKLPGTHFARMAEQRIKQLPRTEEDLEEQNNPKPLRLPSLREDFNAPAAPTAISRADGVIEANRLAERLTEDPNDIGARERLAGVLAEKIGKADLGIEQLDLLIDLADPADEQKAKWLAQIASWEMYLNHDETRFREVLSKIVTEYPKTAQALAAQRRLYLLETAAAETQRTTSKPDEFDTSREIPANPRR